MHARNTYSFSAPALNIDFQRIVDEARETAQDDDSFDTLPSVIRVNIDGRVCTLCSRSTLAGALTHQTPSVVEALLTAPCYDVDDLNFSTRAGDDILEGYDAAEHKHTDWVCFQGDFVKQLTNRREVFVEVF